ncbi:hypothetical protein T484DRAFT_1917060 [Baffinella frigidus]|nr:hypothetical protein T484DRAFT_1917060 [Cryptophyta sp. CCMP2293]
MEQEEQRGEEQRGFECHWQPLSACDAPLALENGAILHRRDDPIAPADPRMDESHFIPDEFRSPSLGVLWWRSQLVGFLLRPNAESEQRVRDAKNQLGWLHPVIGVQVRRGDSCAHADSSSIRPGCQPVDAYLQHVHAMADRYQARTVFLATDDAAVVAEVEADAARRGHPYRVAHLPLDRAIFDSSLFIEYRLALGAHLPLDRAIFDSSFFIEYRLSLGYVDGAAVSDATVLDLLLLAHADFFVGGFGSHFSRLALELSVAMKGRVPPYASVDYPYCFHFLEKRPIGPYPPQFC